MNGSGIIIDFVMVMLLLLLSYYCHLLDLVQTELSRPHMLHVCMIAYYHYITRMDFLE